MAAEVGDIFLAAGAGDSTQWLLCEHGIILLAAGTCRLLIHQQVKECFDLLVKRSESFEHVFLVGESIHHLLDNVVESVNDPLLKTFQLDLVSLLVDQLQQLVQPVIEEMSEFLHFVLDAL